MSVENSVNRVLVIAYYFPPLGLSGVQRTLKFVKYLPEFGWQPTVLTVEDRGYFAKDESLLAELEDLEIEIIRTPSLDPLHFFKGSGVVKMPSKRVYQASTRLSSLFFLPDNKIGWKGKAVHRGAALLMGNSAENTKAGHGNAAFDVVFATAPPFTDFLIGRDLKKLSGIPLVLDYRDPWLENPLHSYPTPLHRALHHRMEKSVLRWADHVIAINRRMKELILNSSSSLSHHDVTIISQGFDPADYADSLPERTDTRMRITHTGTFYFDRSPRAFLAGLQSFLRRRPEAGGKIVAEFVGAFRDEDRKHIASLGLDDSVEVRGYMPHAQCVRETRLADVLWMTIGESRGMDVASTGKLYEYIAAGKPILACMTDCAARRELEKHGAAFFCPPDDDEAISEHIEKLFDLFRARALPAPPADYVAQFDRRLLTGELARIFGKVLRVDGSASFVASSGPAQA